MKGKRIHDSQIIPQHSLLPHVNPLGTIHGGLATMSQIQIPSLILKTDEERRAQGAADR